MKTFPVPCEISAFLVKALPNTVEVHHGPVDLPMGYAIVLVRLALIDPI
jgi:hypothetical protein